MLVFNGMKKTFAEIAKLEASLTEEGARLFKAGDHMNRDFLKRVNEMEEVRDAMERMWHAFYLPLPLIVTRYGDPKVMTFKMLDEKSGDHFGPVLPLPELKDWCFANKPAILARFA